MSSEKYKIEVDTHCHSIASFHAFSTIEEILAKAKKKGLTGIAITDHHPSLEYRSGNSKINAPDFAYFIVFCNRFENTLPNIKLYKGIELNILEKEPWISPIPKRLKGKFDILLAGIHSFPHLFNRSADKDKNTDIIIKAINSGEKPKFTILTHPVVNANPVHIDQVVKACLQRGIAIELNNSYIRYLKSDKQQNIEMVKSVKKHGANLSIGTDTHTPNEIGSFREAINLLNELNFPPQLIVNRTIQTLEKFLGNFK